MEKKGQNPPLDFKNLTPKMQIKRKAFSKFYENSLLKTTGKPESDFSANTTTHE